MTAERIQDTIDAWESGELGRDAQHAQAMSKIEMDELESVIDSAFNLKPISIRMEVDALDKLKSIAKHRGVGYQPLIRQILHRWIDSELKQIALEAMDEKKEEVLVQRYQPDSNILKAA